MKDIESKDGSRYTKPVLASWSMQADTVTQTELKAESPDSNINVTNKKESTTGKRRAPPRNNIMLTVLLQELNRVGKQALPRVALRMDNFHRRKPISQDLMSAAHVVVRLPG